MSEVVFLKSSTINVDACTRFEESDELNRLKKQVLWSYRCLIIG